MPNFLEIIYCLRCGHDKHDHLPDRGGCLVDCGCRDYDSSEVTEPWSADPQTQATESRSLYLQEGGLVINRGNRFLEVGYVWASYIPIIKPIKID